MTHAAGNGIGKLRDAMNGPVITPADPGFDAARQVWNAGVDRRPAAIARCVSTGDVVEATTYARDHDLELSVRADAHSTAGLAVVDDGLMIDLSQLNAVTVDPAARRATAGGGALLADLDAATQEHGLAVPAGLVSHTGVGGLTLGGGMGWLTRKLGLTIDSLLAAEVVTASGQALRASPQCHPDLFWAIRGGGGNFGVVTSFEFGLHDLNPIVNFGLFFWHADHGTEPLRAAREIVAGLPDDFGVVFGALNAPPAPFVPQQHRLAPGYVLLLAGFGPAERHARFADEVRQAAPPLFEIVTPMPYVDLQKMLDEANAWGLYSYDMTTYLPELSDDVIDVIADQVPRKTSPMSDVLFYRLDGAYSQVGDDETAFGGGRSPRYGAFIIGLAPDPDTLAADKEWVRGFWNALRPHAIGSGEGYVNALSDVRADRVRDSYGGAKYDRLAGIKAEYDPANLFHLNANIVPVGR